LLLSLFALGSILTAGGSCPGGYGDHLIVSDGMEWHHSEALHESNYPAVRVEFDGVIRDSEVDDTRKYWTVYAAAVAAIKRAALKRPSAHSDENNRPTTMAAAIRRND